MKLLLHTLLFINLSHSLTYAQPNNADKGLLPEIQLNQNSEDTNQEKSFKSEVLITKTENMAIEKLKKIIKKNVNSPEEADLLYRLSELYMRRAKSGRFFDLDAQFVNRLNRQGLSSQKAQESLRQAIQIYTQISKRFPNFRDMDFVLFNSALAHLQIRETERAKTLYSQLIAQYPNSSLLPDALLELGELYYNQQNFKLALEKFKHIEKYPESRAYPYGLYKSAWCYYNLKNTQSGINQLLVVIKQNPPEIKDQNKYNLRKEALRDLTLFVGETLAPDEVFNFFQKITSDDELGEVMLALANLYESHSRFKEISLFTLQYIKSYPHSVAAPQCYTKLIESNETLKQRNLVIDNLKSMSEFCKNNKADSNCSVEFRKVSLEISKKWWEIWLKNKNNTEFSDLTEKAFENLLSTDTPEKPDLKSRYAYAELLFQRSKFQKASENYELVSQYQGQDASLKHDSLYSALFSIEKLLEKSDNVQISEKQKNLALRYLTEFSEGEHSNEIRYKLAFIFYKQNNLDMSLNYATPLTNATRSSDIKLKSEDLILDIYNIKKDYSKIQSLAREILKKTANNNRADNLNKIIQEAHYSQIQLEMKTLPAEKQIDLLLKFSEAHNASKLAQEALWQAISIAYANKIDSVGANLSLIYIKKFPNDARNPDAYKEAIRAYINSGNLKLAISTLKSSLSIDKINMQKNNELICDLMKINANTDEARSCYKNLFNKTSGLNKNEVLAKLLTTFKNKNSAEYFEIENQILNSNLEPYSTQILIKKANKFLDNKNYAQAFSLSLKINARPVDADFRAEARLIQAQVLEQEFISQSIRTKENKIALVLAMKTEKLDKSYTAFSSAIKMSKNEKIQLLALQGIDRLYSHYIEAVNTMPLPDTLNEAERLALKNELNKLVVPFTEKKLSNLTQIKSVSKITAAVKVALTDWDELSLESSVEAKPKYPDISKFKTYLLSELELKPQFIIKTEARTTQCNVKEANLASLNSCLALKNYSEAENIAFQFTSQEKTRPVGLYYLSLIAEAKSEFDKALWLLEKISTESNNSLVIYQKAKLLYSVEDLNTSLNYFAKLFDTRNEFTNLRIIYALKCFSDGDYNKARDEFSRLSEEQNYTYGMDALHIEANLLTGNIEQALKLAKSYSVFNKDGVELNLELARLYEKFSINKELASQYYTKALGHSKIAEQKNWLMKKIEFIKNIKTNQLTSYVGGQ